MARTHSVEPAAATPAANFTCRWVGRLNGTGTLTVIYTGPLAAREGLQLHCGCKREGTGRWQHTRDVPMRRESERATVASIDVSGGMPTAIQFVVHVGEAWDNGGLSPLGFYEWRPDDAGRGSGDGQVLLAE